MALNASALIKGDEMNRERIDLKYGDRVLLQGTFIDKYDNGNIRVSFSPEPQHREFPIFEINIPADRIIAEEDDIMDNKTPILPYKPTDEEKTELAKNAVKGKYYSPYKLVYDKNRKTIVGMDIHDLDGQPEQPKLPEKLNIGGGIDEFDVYHTINEILDYLKGKE